ncbi:hypothetical protein BH24ACT26_BH24ACT26_01360 [soil metagenome]
MIEVVRERVIRAAVTGVWRVIDLRALPESIGEARDQVRARTGIQPTAHSCVEGHSRRGIAA